jgi:hypothetical protein
VTFDIPTSSGGKREGLFQNQVLVKGADFAEPGDSGSLVVLANPPGVGNAVGLLCAGRPGLYAVTPLYLVRAKLGKPDLTILA